MWILNAEGERIVQLFGNRGENTRNAAERRDRFPSPPTGTSVYAVWPDVAPPEDELPSLIIVAPGEVRNFVAWASTYLGSYRPFTAFCRVVDATHVPSFAALREHPTLGALADACVGIVIGEALTHGRGRVDLKSLTVPICQTTFSFAAGRCMALGYSEGEIGSIGGSVTAARSILQQPARNPTPAEVQVVWQMLSGQGTPFAAPSKGTLFNETAVIHQDIANKGALSEESVRVLSNGALALPVLMKEMAAPRESRVNTFDRLLGRLTASYLHNRVASEILAGYLASLLSPGTFEYVDLVSSYVERFPNLLLWYALFTGRYPANTVLWEHGGFGRKLLRELLTGENILQPPRCDISIDELGVLTERTTAFDFYRQSRQSTLTVEVIPLVSVVIPTPIRARPETIEREADLESWRRLAWLLEEIGGVYRRLAPKHSGTETERQDRTKDRKKRK